ncbi:hypothetical protein [Catenuloplanes atrovinosus]|uniref:Uncharacterized protein n=1 Tax=Catenuloplanes atrovinosus TaxID=137266 RepID=A0AAE3YJT3_9ACTN|nr:hypothetical protein [Catenuloplanes atrovinosus]MDR7273745.1 hypothetical protein [Catenuloplanes atrovinosus]
MRGMLAAAARVDDLAVARLIGDALEVDGTLPTWQRLCAPALAATAGPPTASALALAAGIRQALDDRLVRLARPGRRPTVMLASAPGEPGDLPPSALAAILLEHGVESWRLGADLPWAALSAAVDRAGPARLVVWSAGVRPATEAAALQARHPAVTLIPAGPGWPHAITLAEAASICLTPTRTGH